MGALKTRISRLSCWWKSSSILRSVLELCCSAFRFLSLAIASTSSPCASTRPRTTRSWVAVSRRGGFISGYFFSLY